MRKIILTIVLHIVTVTISWAADPITIDGLFKDWSDVPIAASDPVGDNLSEDFAELKITNDNDFLFLYFRFHNGDQLLQDSNDVYLYIDTDNNAQTGFAINGIGAELIWNFGLRIGHFHYTTGSDSIYQNDITLRKAPSVSAEQFEIAISRRSKVLTLMGTQTADTVAVVFVESDPMGDRLPNMGNVVQYVIDPTFVEPPEPISLLRYDERDLRILTYNVQNHRFSVFEDEAMHPRLERILKALDPDIIAFQHVHTDSIVSTLISSWFPNDEWYMMGMYGPPGEYFVTSDKFVFSKYPILEQEHQFISTQSMSACLIDTKPQLGSNLLIINTHLWAFGRNDFRRQRDADKFIQAMREWRVGNGPFQLEDNTPFLVVGDFNMYGKGQVLRTLVEGDIWDEAIYGEDFAPDWDGTPITDLFSRHTHIRMGYTWRGDTSPFSPGKLDYFLYSNSVINIGNHFVLNTLAMPESDLSAYGLQMDDTDIISEHLPRVLDITHITTVGVKEKVGSGLPDNFELYHAYPNPFNPTTTIQFSVAQRISVAVKVFDILGKEITTLVNDEVLAPGMHKRIFDADHLPNGIYLYRMQAGEFEQTRKLTLLK